ncbi:MAG: class I SAM-dependent methyltransferase [Rhodobacteraceae bacterium]|nr:class I SAM-dependent methyltransferase [Paracoccaceae bacterium]
MTSQDIRAGDFTDLARAYASHRPGYAPSVADSIVALLPTEPSQAVAVDVGAGTGIWTRMLAPRVARVIAIEPNDAMRAEATVQCAGLNIEVRAGSGEATGLTAGGADLLTMASSFHWVDFENGLAEFHRVLRPGGTFAALWNPRVIPEAGILREIEDHILTLKPDLVRKSSGNSAFTETLNARFANHPLFEPAIALEATHIEHQSRERYLGLWRSVNDIRAQLGPEKWEAFMTFVERQTENLKSIDVTYKTRAWCARRRD